MKQREAGDTTSMHSRQHRNTHADHLNEDTGVTCNTTRNKVYSKIPAAISRTSDTKRRPPWTSRSARGLLTSRAGWPIDPKGPKPLQTLHKLHTLDYRPPEESFSNHHRMQHR